MQSQLASALPARNASAKHIRSLAGLFARKCAQDKGLPFRPLTTAAEALLASHDWKSDLSAMEATIRRAAIMAEGDVIGAEVIRLPGLPSDGGDMQEAERVPEPALRTLLGHTVSEVERDLILVTLECCQGNRTRAADILDISVRTLRNKLKEYSLSGLAIPSSGEIRTKTAARGRGQPGTTKAAQRNLEF